MLKNFFSKQKTQLATAGRETHALGAAYLLEGVDLKKRKSDVWKVIRRATVAGLFFEATMGTAHAQATVDMSGVMTQAKAGAKGILDMVRLGLYVAAVIILIIFAIYAAWKGDKEYVMKGLWFAIGVAVAGFATKLVSGLGFAPPAGAADGWDS